MVPLSHNDEPSRGQRCAYRMFLKRGKSRRVPIPNMSSEHLTIVTVPESHFSEGIVHLRFNFFADEPLNAAVGLCRRGERHVELEKHCLATLKQGFSRMIVSEDGMIAGMALNGVLKKGEREEAERRLLEIDDEKFKVIFGLLYRVNEKVDLFSKYDVQDVFECRILSVDERFRGKGLANRLMKDSLDTAKEAGFKVVKADATGIYSQKACLKHGFEVEAEIPYSEIDESVRPAPPHEALKLMVKVLK